MCGSGSPLSKTGYMMHLYLATVSMDRAAFCNADGDLLIIPQQGALDITTEMGRLHVAPKEICVIQRGMHFSVDLPQAGPARGYVLELFEGHFVLPELGPIGANGLANPRDFQVQLMAHRRFLAFLLFHAPFTPATRHREHTVVLCASSGAHGSV